MPPAAAMDAGVVVVLEVVGGLGLELVFASTLAAKRVEMRCSSQTSCSGVKAGAVDAVAVSVLVLGTEVIAGVSELGSLIQGLDEKTAGRQQQRHRSLLDHVLCAAHAPLIVPPTCLATPTICRAAPGVPPSINSG